MVGSGREAVAALRAEPVDVVLLDFYLPDTTGLAVCQAIRRTGKAVDVIAVTSARDLDVVRSAISLGVVQYIIKPFTSALLREKLERYAAYRRSADQVSGPLAQQEVDALLAKLRGSSLEGLPKKLSEATLNEVIDALRTNDRPQSASEVGGAVGIARVTARRYLEHLTETGLAERRLAYGGPGRPEQLYRWVELGSS